MLKLVYEKVVVDNSKGKEQAVYINYYLLTDSGYRIAIKPTFKEDFSKMRVLAEKYED